MNKKDLDFILQEGEGLKIEFKESIGNIDKDMVAFANTEGGKIFVGIDDARRIKGIELSNKLKAQIVDIAKNCDPAININISYFGGVVIIEVPPSEDKPHKCSSGFFLRKDATSQKMARDELIDFIFDQGRKKFDSLICHKFNPKDLDKNFLKNYLKMAGITTKAPVNETLFNLGVFENDKINNAGVLFFSKFPKRYFIHAYITCARYLGIDKVEVLDRADFEGNAVSQIDEAIKFIRRNTRLSYKIKDIKREEIPEYPIEALREAVVNAVMHRDYFETGANVQVDIFDNRIAISNIGALIKPLTKEKLGTIAVRRNPLIADLFHRIGYVEKMGTGLKRIKEECKKYRAKLKIETNGYFIIAFKPMGISGVVNGVVSGVVNRKEKLRQYLTENKRIRSEEYKNLTGVSFRTAQRDLSLFQRQDLIRFTGAPKTGYYVLITEKRGT